MIRSPELEELLASKPKLHVSKWAIRIDDAANTIQVAHAGVVLSRAENDGSWETVLAIDYEKLATEGWYRDNVRQACMGVFDAHHRNVSHILWKRVLDFGMFAKVKRWGDRFDKDIVDWAMKELAKLSEGRDYADNFRVGRLGHSTSMRRFAKQKGKGCCGSVEQVLTGPDGHRYVLGFNYGH